MDAVWENVNSRLGVTSDTVQKIKFGRGAVGKISIVAVASVTGIAAVGLRGGANFIYMAMGSIVLITLACLGLIFYIICNRPELAVMEGAELVMYKHVQLAAKGYTPTPEELKVQFSSNDANAKISPIPPKIGEN
jgi:hypothetical protein